jgi:hypothetical protein
VGKKAKRDERPIWVCDAETDPFLKDRYPVPFIWGLYNGVSFHTFKTTAELIEFVREQEVILYAHNGGKFDFHFMLDFIDRYEPVKVINGRLVSAKIGKCEIRDSFSLLPEKLADFGSKLEIDYAKLEAKVRAQHMPEIIEYLKQDCIGLYDAITAFIRKYGLHLTQAGAALRFWENISGKKAPRTSADYFKKFAKFYYGGRVQCFESGEIEGPIEVYDIRSAYAWAMKDKHPYDPVYRHIMYPRTVEPQDMVTLWAVSLGALPYREDGRGMTFPDDNVRRQYHVTGHEVLAAMDTGSLRDVEIIEAIRFSNLIDFGVYIDYFWHGRKQDIANGDTVESLFKKRLMNSLYGKWAANPDNYGNFMLVPWAEKMSFAKGGENYDGKRNFEFNGLMNGPEVSHAVVRADLDHAQKRFLNVATSASITGQVRAKLWRGLHASMRPIYCDTDCIMAQAASFIDNGGIGGELGQWNLEGTADRAFIAGKKLYYLTGAFEKGKKTKQASKGAKLTGDEIKSVARGKVVTWEAEAPTYSLSGKRGRYFQKRNVRMTAVASRESMYSESA